MDKKVFFYILKSKANNSDIYFFSQGDPNDPGYKQLNWARTFWVNKAKTLQSYIDFSSLYCKTYATELKVCPLCVFLLETI